MTRTSNPDGSVNVTLNNADIEQALGAFVRSTQGDLTDKDYTLSVAWPGTTPRELSPLVLAAPVPPPPAQP